MKNNNEFKIFLKKSELCKAVCLMNKDIRFVAVINKNGRFTENESKDDSLLSEKELEMISMQRLLQTSMIQEFDKKLSPFNQTIAIREHAIEFVCPLNGELLFILSNKNVDIKQMSADLLSLVDNFNMKDPNTIVV